MKVYKCLLLVVLLLLSSCIFACGGKNKSVELTLENYKDYLEIEVATSNYSHTIHINVKSRNSDYIFEKCEIEVLPTLWGAEINQNNEKTWNERLFYPQGATAIKVERNGNATYTNTLRGYKVTARDGKNYSAEQYSSYTILSVKGKVSKNPLN